MPDNLEIHCPCCEALLVIDASSGHVIFHKEKARPAGGGVSFEQMVSDIAVKKSEAARRLDRELEAQKDRGRILDARFKEAMERASGKKTE